MKLNSSSNNCAWDDLGGECFPDPNGEEDENDEETETDSETDTETEAGTEAETETDNETDTETDDETDKETGEETDETDTETDEDKPEKDDLDTIIEVLTKNIMISYRFLFFNPLALKITYGRLHTCIIEIKLGQNLRFS